MKTILLLTKEDVECAFLGQHIVIETKGDVKINLDPDACIELSKQLNLMLKETSKNYKWSYDSNGSVFLVPEDQQQRTKFLFDTKKQAAEHWKDTITDEYMKENNL